MPWPGIKQLQHLILHATLGTKSQQLTEAGERAGQMKDILTTGLGMFMFGDVMLEVKNLLGVLVGLVGGIAYGALQFHASQDKSKASKPGYRPLPSGSMKMSPNSSLSSGSLKGPSGGSLKALGPHKLASP